MIIQAVVVIIRCEYNSSQGQTDSRGSQKNLDRNNKSQQWAGPFYKINSNKIKMIFAPSFPTCYLMLLPPPALIWNYVRGGPPCPFWFPSGFFWDTLYFYKLPKGEAFFITQQLENIQWEVEQDKVNNADSALIFLISQNQWSCWSGRRRWSWLVWSLLER